jgi:hypothetical protein
LQIESIAGSILMGLREVGVPLRIIRNYGSFNVESPAASIMAPLMPLFSAALSIAATVLLFAHLRRLNRPGPSGSFARLHPGVAASYTLLFLLLFIMGNKVFSPQYLLWLPPLLCLFPLDRESRSGYLWACFGLCLLTILVFPVLFYRFLTVTGEGGRDLDTPWVLILVLRNALFVGLSLFVARRIFRQFLDLGGRSANDLDASVPASPGV